MVEYLQFDSSMYIQQVLRQYRRPDSGVPSLIEFYALNSEFIWADDAAIIRRVSDVVEFLDRQARDGTAGLAEVCVRFLKADQRLQSRYPDGYRNPQWWRAKLPKAALRAVPTARTSHPDALGTPSSETENADVGDDATDRDGHAEQIDLQLGHRRLDSAESLQAAAPSSLQPPTRLRAEITFAGITLTWQPSSGAPPGISYVAERSNIDGSGRQVVGAPVGATRLTDNDPPVGREVEYVVFALLADSDERIESEPCRAQFRPPVRDLRVQVVRPGVVQGSWSCHPGAHSVKVWRTVGRTPENPEDGVSVEGGLNGFHDSPVPLGEHHYNVMPFYWNVDTGMPARGKHVFATVNVCEPPPMPDLLSIEQTGPDGSADIELTAAPLPDGVLLQLRRLTSEPDGGAGDVVGADVIGGFGERLGEASGYSVADHIRLAIPAGRWTIVPFAVAGGLAVRGIARVIEVVPTAAGLEEERHGVAVLVSWIWPTGVSMAHLRWHTTGSTREFQITRAEYYERGGIEFRCVDGAEVTVTQLHRSGDVVLRSSPRSIVVPMQPLTLTYAVTARWPIRTTGSLSRRYQVTLTANWPCDGLRVEVYLGAPREQAGDRVLVASADGITLGLGRSYRLSVTLPLLASMRRPRYLSCRAWDSSGRPVNVDDFGSTGKEVRG